MTISKMLTVLNINTATELTTGDNMYQVVLGYYTERTPEIMNRIPDALKQTAIGKQIGITELVLFIKKQEIPYRVGSKWELTIRDNGTLNLVEAK